MIAKPRQCKRCGCWILTTDSDECERSAGWCALLVARQPTATEEDQLIADAVAELARLDDARKARKARAAG